ncbi:MAG: hypothetical protein HY686_05745 [Chloroflexi bacterium]|nr:hypothetical protein [Chloroflexota bacterium]
MARKGRLLLLATRNPAKVERLRWLVEGLGFSLRTPEAVAHPPPVEETGATHLANARLKALAWSKAARCLALASDGGLVIPALGAQWDSLHTGRFAGEGASDRARVEALLRLMAPYRGDERRAYWMESVVVAERGQVLAAWEVQSGDGLIAETLDPDHPIVPNFWAATVWCFPKLNKTYAELTESELRQVGDHWTKLREKVQRFFREGYRCAGHPR